jgi:2-polyprenyl-6-methoxyphenol hydroxylase-like FAD-dependent oxidoreductase
LIYRWGIHDLIEPLSSHANFFKIFRNDGKFLTSQAMSTRRGNDPSPIWRNAPGYDMHWGDLHQIFLNTAREYGADIRFGSPVTRYFESEESAGVEADGKEYIADVVIGADGTHPSPKTCRK